MSSDASAALAPSDAVATRASAMSTRDALSVFAGKTLKAAASAWFVVAVLGQLIFVAYVLALYGGTTIRGRFQDWNTVMSHGYDPGDSFGNLVVAAHLLTATLVILAGALQLVPAVRRRWPAFHRWNGKVYLSSAVLASAAGLFMIWVRGVVGGDATQHVAISINAVLNIGFAGLAYRHARARRIDVHRRWALRLFLAMLGAWFFRIGLLFWLVVNHGPVGFDPKTFTGPFITFLSFAQFLLPLALLQLYFHAQSHAGAYRRLAVAAGLFAMTVVTAVGVFGATMVLWLPHM